jgi:Tfp pilus assembly PilM family ATPase
MDDDMDRADREKVSLSGDHRVLSALNEYRHKVTMAIEDSINSYVSLRKVKVRIAGITLAGGGSLIRGLPETLQAHFRIPVMPALFETNIAGDYSEFHTGKVTNADFRAAVGLGMGALV